jgi:hypothetical protein
MNIIMWKETALRESKGPLLPLLASACFFSLNPSTTLIALGAGKRLNSTLLFSLKGHRGDLEGR